MISRFGLITISLFLWQKRTNVPANCLGCSVKAILNYLSGPGCFSFSSQIRTILQALRCTRYHLQVREFSSPRKLLICSCHSYLSSTFPFYTFWQSALATISSPQSFLFLFFLPHLTSTIHFFALFFYPATLVLYYLFFPGNDTVDWLARQYVLL